MQNPRPRPLPPDPKEELGQAIARILQDRDLRLKLEACTMRIGGKSISAVEMLGGRAAGNADDRSLIGAVTRVLGDRMVMATLRMYCSSTNSTSISAADVLLGYALNPNNWGIGSRDVRAAPMHEIQPEDCRGWALAIGHC